MLVLTRKHKEQIQIGDAITVTVLRVKGKSVRIGIEAPQDVRIVRTELPRADAGKNSPPRSPQSRRDDCRSGDVLSNWESGAPQPSVRNDAPPERTLEDEDHALPGQLATLHILMARRKRRKQKLPIPR